MTPATCSEIGCAAPKHPKAGFGMCHTHYWRKYRAERRETLDANYKAWRTDRGSRWALMGEDERDAYRAANANRRALRRGSRRFRVTQADLARALSRAGHRCAYCSVRLATVQWDHVMPLSAGGTHSIGNLVPACERCNKSKGSLTVMEWRVTQATGRIFPRRLRSAVTLAA